MTRRTRNKWSGARIYLVEKRRFYFSDGLERKNSLPSDNYSAYVCLNIAAEICITAAELKWANTMAFTRSLTHAKLSCSLPPRAHTTFFVRSFEGITFYVFIILHKYKYKLLYNDMTLFRTHWIENMSVCKMKVDLTSDHDPHLIHLCLPRLDKHWHKNSSYVVLYSFLCFTLISARIIPFSFLDKVRSRAGLG